MLMSPPAGLQNSQFPETYLTCGAPGLVESLTADCRLDTRELLLFRNIRTVESGGFLLWSVTGNLVTLSHFWEFELGVGSKDNLVLQITRGEVCLLWRMCTLGWHDRKNDNVWRWGKNCCCWAPRIFQEKKGHSEGEKSLPFEWNNNCERQNTIAQNENWMLSFNYNTNLLTRSYWASVPLVQLILCAQVESIQ